MTPGALPSLGKRGYAVLCDRFSTLPDLAVAGKKLLNQMPDRCKARNPEIGFQTEKFFEVAERLSLDQV